MLRERAWYFLSADGIGEILVFCLDNVAYTARYDAALLDVADAFEVADLESQMDAWSPFLAEDIATDVRGEQSAETIALWTEQTRAVIQDAAERIRAEVGACSRRTLIRPHERSLAPPVIIYRCPTLG